MIYYKYKLSLSLSHFLSHSLLFFYISFLFSTISFIFWLKYLFLPIFQYISVLFYNFHCELQIILTFCPSFHIKRSFMTVAAIEKHCPRYMFQCFRSSKTFQNFPDFQDFNVSFYSFLVVNFPIRMHCTT